MAHAVPEGDRNEYDSPDVFGMDFTYAGHGVQEETDARS